MATKMLSLSGWRFAPSLILRRSFLLVVASFAIPCLAEPVPPTTQHVLAENNSWRLLLYQTRILGRPGSHVLSFDENLMLEDKRTRVQSFVLGGTNAVSKVRLSEDGVVMTSLGREFYFPGRPDSCVVTKIRFSAACPPIRQRVPPGFQADRSWFQGNLFIYEGSVAEVGGPFDPKRQCLGYMRLDLAGQTVVENRIIAFWREKNSGPMAVWGDQIFAEKQRIYWRNQGADEKNRAATPEEYRDSQWHCYDMDRQTISVVDARTAAPALLEKFQQLETKKRDAKR